jgi:hypothetical protein
VLDVEGVTAVAVGGAQAFVRGKHIRGGEVSAQLLGDQLRGA